MALADSVPGVSGGTVAFILGFYEKFIESLRNVFTKDKQLRKDAMLYLGKLGIGWVIGFLSSVMVLSALFEKNIYFMSSLFLGLSLAAIPFIIRAEKDIIKGRYINLIYTVIGFMLVAGLSLMRQSGAGIPAIAFHSLDASQMIYLFISGLVAITAMVLPGISGSTLLLIFGVYIPMINGISSIMRGNFTPIVGVVCVGFGVLAGVIFSVRVIRAAFRKFRVQCIYLILGLVAGSLIAITMGPTTLEIPQAALSLETFKPIGFIIGIGLLLGVELMPKIKEKFVK